jgi:hypothetical protein
MLSIIDLTTNPQDRIQNQRGRARAIEKLRDKDPAYEFIADNQYGDEP